MSTAGLESSLCRLAMMRRPLSGCWRAILRGRAIKPGHFLLGEHNFFCGPNSRILQIRELEFKSALYSHASILWGV